MTKDETIISSPLLMQIGARIRHLNLVFFIETYDTTWYSYPRLFDGIVHCMTTLKARCPNLKTCIQTADIVRFSYVNGPPRGPLPLPLAMFEPQVLQALHIRSSSQNRTLLTELSKLFELFADTEIGKASFVRVRYSECNQCTSRARLVASHHYGPLVEVDRSSPMGLSQTAQTSLGARLLDLTYRLERSGPLLERAKHYSTWR
jgi:hypothetical protein